MTYAQILQKRSTKIAEAKRLRDEITIASEFSQEKEDAFNAIMSEVESLTRQAETVKNRERFDSVLDTQGETEPRTSNPLPTEDPANTRNGQHEFSILRAANRILSGRPVDGIEAETLQEYSRRSGVEFDSNQFLVPHSLPVQKRGITSAAGSAGKAIETSVSPTLIDFLRNSLQITGLGATVLADLYGNVSLPKQTAIASGGWKAEGVAFDESDPVIDQVPMTPKRVGTFIEVTRQVVRQSSVDIENMIRNDLIFAVAAAIDRAAINGSGSGAEPQGILPRITSGTQLVSLGTNGTAPTWAMVVDLMGRVDTQNALMGNLAYLTTPSAVASFLKTPKVAGQPLYIMEDLTQSILGYPVRRSNQVPSNLTKGTGTSLSAAIFGDWSALYVGMWGGSIVTVNPYSKDTSGIVRMTIENMSDINVRHIESFAVCRDIVTT